MDRIIAVKLENISKFYKLYNTPKDRLKEALDPFRRQRHRKYFALRQINLTIHKGEILGIVGRNGSGKSTLLKIVAGILQPSSGQVTTHGAIAELVELHAGLNSLYSGIQNIRFQLTMMGWQPQAMATKIEEIADFAQLGEFITQPIKTYSSGMRARLGFAIASNINPDILIVDEVLSVGDDLFRRKCYAKMEQLFQSGCTVLFVSHSVNNINEICTRAVLIESGEIILNGLPKLVTGYYQKLLFANPQDASLVRKEIIQLNDDENKKREFALHPEKLDTQTPDRQTIHGKAKQQKPTTEAYYIPNFQPTSTVITKNYDVDIDDLHIRTLQGKKVNALILGEEYIYGFKVRFHIDAYEIGLGVAFKTEKGLNLSHSNLKGNYIKVVKKGTVLTVEQRFKCIFLPGVYYTNVAAGARVDGERKFLHRIVDAHAFKVLPDGKPPNISGLVYCNQFLRVVEEETINQENS